MSLTPDPWEDPRAEFEPIHRMIERRVDQHPDRPALTCLDRTLRYGEVDGLVNGLAETLTRRGVGHGDVVPVLLVNSLELPIVDLALMKLGAAFVPLDPAWPTERIRSALTVLAPELVLCANPESAPPEFRPACLVVDIDDITASGSRPAVAVGPDDLIYGIFTSGTTGPGKCAMNRHAGLTNRFRFMSRYFAATGDEVVLQNSKHTFDSSVWQLLWPLTTGGRCVIPAQGAFLNIEHTISSIAAHGITMTDFVPSVFNAVVSIVEHSGGAQQKLSSLRNLIVGGEEITPPMVHRLMSLLPDIHITNGYGPTEASIGMIFHQVTPADGDVIPLGLPIDNCYAIIVDEALRPLPPGEIGQIVIGGACLGAGYLADPERTAEVFVDNPFPHIPGNRIYLTGDLGHADAEGRLFFAGRKDFQVKIGGVRIELGEIEAAAESCPGVRHAKALVAQRADTKSLALFVCGDIELTEDRLRAHLRTMLPRTNLPQYCFVLPELPLTEVGKVDRRALRATLDQRLEEETSRLAELMPRTVAEQVLQVFRSVLGQPDLDRDADFMTTGGDSLRAVSAMVRLSAENGLDIGVQDLFDHPTATRMASMIEGRRLTGGGIEAEATLIERDVAAPLPNGLPTQRLRLHAMMEPMRVLVTGATGFVGARVVFELLANTDLTVRCLVRAPDDFTATARVAGTLADLGLWQAGFADRVEGYAGDLSQPKLGLSTSVWDHLARSTDLVVHIGALVNFLYNYRVHRPANVAGTAEVLRLALEHHAKPLHHISTLGVLDGEAVRHRNPLPEPYDASRAVTPDTGYSRSKWAAERYLARARHHGALVTILRLGEVMPSEDNGYPNPHSLTHLLLSTIHQLGMSPTASIRSDYTPVDYVATRIVATIRDQTTWGRTLHIFHPESVCFADVLSRVGTPITRVPCVTFLSRLREAAADTNDRDLAALLALLPSTSEVDERTLSDAFSRLLVDNPRLFRKDECARLERRWRLTDEWLHGPITAYRNHLDRHSAAAQALANN